MLGVINIINLMYCWPLHSLNGTILAMHSPNDVSFMTGTNFIYIEYCSYSTGEEEEEEEEEEEIVPVMMDDEEIAARDYGEPAVKWCDEQVIAGFMSINELKLR